MLVNSWNPYVDPNKWQSGSAFRTNMLENRPSCLYLQHTAAHCRTLQHACSRCLCLQHTKTQYTIPAASVSACIVHTFIQFNNTLQYTAIHCSALQHTATQCKISPLPDVSVWNIFVCTATHCNTLQYSATHCIMLQHTASHCNTLQCTATHTLPSQTSVF